MNENYKNGVNLYNNYLHLESFELIPFMKTFAFYIFVNLYLTKLSIFILIYKKHDND
jgi:hypothetical protein